MIPGIGSMGGAELLILKELSEEAARLGDEGETKEPRNNEDGKDIAPNAVKGESSV
jgi:hypothetical protein